MSEKVFTRKQVGFVRRQRRAVGPQQSRWGLLWRQIGGKLVVSRAGEAYDARAGGPNRKFR